MFPGIIKTIDRITGPLLVSLPRESKQYYEGTIRSVLIIRPGGIGDAVLLTSTIQSLRNSFPDIHITILAEQRNLGVFSLISGVDEVLRYDHPLGFIKVMRSRYDVVIDTEQSYRLSAVVARLIRAPMKIGFDTNNRKRMFTHGIQYDPDAYEADNFLSLLEPLGVSFQNDNSFAALSLPLQPVSNANQLLLPLCSDNFVVISPGTSIPEKRWGSERFGLVAKQLAEVGYKVVVVGSKDDKEDGDKIAVGVGLNLAGGTTLAETGAVIARSSLVISGDTGVLHIAVSLGIPTVSLFGPSSVAKWAPKGDRHIVLNHNLPCSPCSKFGTIPHCQINARCIKDITPEEVLDAVGRLINLNG